MRTNTKANIKFIRSFWNKFDSSSYTGYMDDDGNMVCLAKNENGKMVYLDEDTPQNRKLAECEFNNVVNCTNCIGINNSRDCHNSHRINNCGRLTDCYMVEDSSGCDACHELVDCHGCFDCHDSSGLRNATGVNNKHV